MGFDGSDFGHKTGPFAWVRSAGGLAFTSHSQKLRQSRRGREDKTTVCPSNENSR
jgi:hypothetical protein